MLDKNGVIKIADFGLAIFLGEQEKAFEIVGTPLFMPPEMMYTNKGYSYDIDIRALGIIFYELLEGKNMFLSNETTSDITIREFYKSKVCLLSVQAGLLMGQRKRDARLLFYNIINNIYVRSNSVFAALIDEIVTERISLEEIIEKLSEF